MTVRYTDKSRGYPDWVHVLSVHAPIADPRQRAVVVALLPAGASSSCARRAERHSPMLSVPRLSSRQRPPSSTWIT